MSRTDSIGETITGSTAYRTPVDVEPDLPENKKKETLKERVFFLAKVIAPYVIHFSLSFWMGTWCILTWFITAFCIVGLSLASFDRYPKFSTRRILVETSYWFFFIPQYLFRFLARCFCQLMNWIKNGET